MPTPFETQTRLTQIAMAMYPMDFIADDVCPRVGTGARKFTYTKADQDQFFQIPDTHIGRTSRANRVEFTAKDVDASTVAHGLEDPVPESDIAEARDQMANWDPLGTAIMGTALLVHLAREKRVADLYFKKASYPTGQEATLSGTSRWTQAGSKPRKAIMEAMDKMVLRPNLALFGQSTWTAFRQNAEVVESVKSTGAGADAEGMISRQQAADLLEVPRIAVGRSHYISSKPGQDATYARLWGPHCALLHINPAVQSTRARIPTFGFTAEWYGMMGGSYFDESIGERGCEVVKVIDHVRELISWPEAGYLFENAGDAT